MNRKLDGVWVVKESFRGYSHDTITLEDVRNNPEIYTEGSFLRSLNESVRFFSKKTLDKDRYTNEEFVEEKRYIFEKDSEVSNIARVIHYYKKEK